MSVEESLRCEPDGLRPVLDTSGAALLLLSKDRTFPDAEQLRLGLPEFAGVAPRPNPRRRYRPRPAEPSADDDLEALYEQRLRARCSERTVGTYRWLRRDMLRIASRSAGRDITLLDLFRELELMGRVLVTDECEDGSRASKSTIAHRRTAIRSVATLLNAELRETIGRDPHDIVRDALRAVAERRGAGYRIAAGTSRTRGGPTPTNEELDTILGVLGQGRGWDAQRNRGFFLLLARTAARVNSMRILDGADCAVLPGNRVRLLLHQKNGDAKHEVELDRESVDALRLYVAMFNRAMQLLGKRDRIVLGQPGPVWRSAGGGRWSESAVRRTIRSACADAGLQDYTPHALRRLWANGAAEVLPRWEAAQAGGWRGTERFDQHYVAPSRARTWRKLARLTYGSSTSGATEPNLEHVDGPAVPI